MVPFRLGEWAFSSPRVPGIKNQWGKKTTRGTRQRHKRCADKGLSSILIVNARAFSSFYLNGASIFPRACRQGGMYLQLDR